MPAEVDGRRLEELRQVVYRTLVEEGRPPRAAEAARRLGTSEDEVVSGWRLLHDRHVLVLDDDRTTIRMAHPFSARWMGFLVASEEQKWWGGCAWDSFGIMAALDRPVLVATTCVGCGRPLALHADPAKPPDDPAVVHVLVPAARWWDDVVWTCSNIRLACDAGHAPNAGAVVDLPTMWRLASVWYGDRLRDDFRRRTPAEANAIFAELGLSGPFWALPG